MMTATAALVEEVTFVEAVCAAQRDAMAEDDTIVLLGQDIVAGFPFGATKGLVEAFGPDRVLNTPISESATMGCGVGAALAGLRPVVEVDFAGFLYLGLDQLLNNAAKMRYMSSGQVRVPLVVRVGQGPLGSFAAQHSQSLHALLAATPGMAVLAPSDAQSAYDCIRWALRQQDPVVVCEDLRIYRTKGPLRRSHDPTVGARRVRVGTDATVLAYGAGTGIASRAADRLSHNGLAVQVIDLVSLAPLDVGVIAAAARSTGRVVCLADDSPFFGVGPTIASIATCEAWDVLAAPVLTVSAKPVPVPYAARLESQVYPTEQSVEVAVRQVMNWAED